MARSKANTGYLSTFELGDNNSPIGYSQIAEVKSIKLFEMSTAEVDVSHLRSPNNVMERRPGQINPGTVELTGNFTADTSQLAILGMQESRTVFPFRVQAPCNNNTQTYQAVGYGFIGKYTPGSLDATKATDFAITIVVDGYVTESVISSPMASVTA